MRRSSLIAIGVGVGLAACHGAAQPAVVPPASSVEVPPRTAKPNAAQPSAPVPTAIAGFRFGMTVPEFLAHCAEVGQPNATVDDDGGILHHECDQVEVEPGLRMDVLVGFCGDGSLLCEMGYFAQKDAIARLATLDRNLRERYGPAHDSNTTLRDRNVAAQCAGDGGALRRTWWWGHPGAFTGRLLLTFDCKPSNDPLVYVVFDDAVGTAHQIRIARAAGVWPF